MSAFALCVVQSRFFQELKKAGAALSLDFPDCDLYLPILTVVTAFQVLQRYPQGGWIQNCQFGKD